MTEIKLSEQQVADIQQYMIPLQTLRQKGKDLSKKLQLLEAQLKAISMQLWIHLEEIYPQVANSKWTLDAEEYCLFEKQEKGPDIPDILRKLLG